jgi:hypothetical protein
VTRSSALGAHQREERPASVRRLLILGDFAYQYPIAPSAGTPLAVLGLKPDTGNGLQATEFVEAGVEGLRLVQILSDASGDSALGATDGHALWKSAHRGTDGRGLSGLAPLVLLRTHSPGSDGLAVTEVLACSRIRSRGALFTRVARLDRPYNEPLETLVAISLEASTCLRDRTLAETNGYTVFEKGTEIERKITLLDEVSIWALAKELWAAVDSGGLGAFRTDPGYELTRWNLRQHNFEVLAPRNEQGHLGFIEKGEETYTIKRKRFTQDGLRRGEQLHRGIHVSGEAFADFLAVNHPALETRQLDSFTRARFDVNFESTVTGHYYGIHIDEVHLCRDESRTLRQVEIEYLQTRVHEGIDPSSIDTELERLEHGVIGQLSSRGVRASPGFYSKLSFLNGQPLGADAGSVV